MTSSRHSGISKNLFLLAVCAACTATPVMAQVYGGELPADQSGMDQIDITGGLADRSASYAARVTGAPSRASAAPISVPNPVQGPAAVPQDPSFQQFPLNGSCSQNEYGNQQQSLSMPQPMPQQNGFTVPQQMLPADAAMDLGMFGDVPQQLMDCGAMFAQPQAQPQASQGGPNLSTQAIGLLGAAAVFTYMTQGGMDNIMDGMRARGFNTRRQLRGAHIGY